ncbi:MAG: GDSL-type esterase/lipase family protein [Actinoplanes sp.]
MRRLAAVVLLVLLVVGYFDGRSPARSEPDPTKRTVVFAALGDSITTAAGTCGPYFLCYDNSWATGTEVHSVYRRLQAANPTVNIQPVNLAEPGVGASHLFLQGIEATALNAAYITILIGANDACRWPMIDARDFRAEIDSGLDVLRRADPRPRLYLVSIPNVVQLWQVTRRQPLARLIWRLQECPSLMMKMPSTAASDERRERISERIGEYNRELAEACVEYGKRCQWDGGRAHRVRFTLKLVGRDYFHPSLRGQQELAKTQLPAEWIGR